MNGIYAFQFGSATYYLYDTVNLNTWYYMTYVYTNRSVKLYKNGILKTLQTNNSTDALNYCPFTIGAKASPAYDTWNAYIDELAVYKRALDSAEVNQLYNLNSTPELTGNLKAGLLAYYPFTGNANDSSGNNNNGTAIGATLTTDRFGNPSSAYFFNGNSYIQTSFLPPTASNPRTVAGWYKTNSQAGAIICYGINSGSCDYAGGRFMVDFENVRLRLDGTCSAKITNSSTDTNWHHFAVSYDPSFSGSTPQIQDIKLYIDGNQVTDDELYNGTTPFSTLSVANLFIGRNADNTDTRYFMGSIDDIFVYNRALSDAEIKQLYNLNQTTILPINILSFNGSDDAGKEYLTWECSQAVNFSRFEVQYSTNATDFTSVGNIPGAKSNANLTNYSFIYPVSSAQNYYRLKLVDDDGNFKYSKTILVLKNARHITLYPNPVTDYANLAITTDKSETIKVVITDIAGRILSVQQKTLIPGINTLNIKTSFLSKGVYEISVLGSAYKQTLKILKQ